MRLQRFFFFIVAKSSIPKGVSPQRWRAMHKWYKMRVKLREEFVYPKEADDDE